MKRPLLRVTLLFVAGILAASFGSLPLPLLLGLTLGLAGAALAWGRARAVLLCLLIFLTGWTNLTLRTVVLSPHDLRRILGQEPALVTLRGRLRETPSLRLYPHEEQDSWRTMAKMDVTALRLHHQAWQPATGRVAITTPGTLTNFFAGQVLEITGVARLPKVAAAEGTFDYRAYLSQLGIHYQLQASSEKDWQILSSPSAPPLADRFRAWARSALASGLPCEDESLRLEWALTLGWKTALTEEVSDPFVRAATYHIFAVDGLRMAIVFGIFFGLFRVLSLSRAICGLLLLPLIWFYVALTGWPASAIRATVMLTVVIVGWVLRRPSDLLNSLFAAAFIILIWEPQQLFQAGFQLSFFVVLCLILTVPVLHHLIQRLTFSDPLLPDELRRQWPATVIGSARFLTDLLLTSFAAWIGSLPLVAYYFNIVTPVSTPANIVAVPLCGLVLVSNLASLLLVGWLPAAAQVFNHAGWFLMECIRVTSHWFADWPRAYFYVPAPSLFTSALYYGALLAVVTGWLFRAALRPLKIAALILAVLFWGWHAWREHNVARLSVLALNGGSALYFDAPGAKEDLLVNCGSAGAVQFVTKAFLRAQGVNRLPTLLVTHGAVREMGGAQRLADLFSVQQVCASPISFRSLAYRELLEDLRRRPEKLRIVSRSDRLGGWTVLHPEASGHFPQADDNAVVLSGTFCGTRVLLLSDLGRAGQKALLETTPDLRADIVVTGLPVQPEALGEALLDAIRPRLIIVTDSEFPVSERASSNLCARLARRNIPVVYTRSAGAVTIEFRKDAWEARSMSGLKVRSPHALPPGTVRADPGPH